HQLEQGGFAGAVAADHAEGFAAGHREVHFLQGRDRLLGFEAARQAPPDESALQGPQPVARQGPAIELADLLDADGLLDGRRRGLAHAASTSVSRSRSKSPAPNDQATRLTRAIWIQRRGSGSSPRNSTSW